RLGTSENIQTPYSWSSDGKWLAFSETGGTTLGSDLLVLRLDQGHTPQPLLKTPFAESAPHISPDGAWFAYQSDEPGRNEIFVQAFPGVGRKWQISFDGGIELVWSRTGREVFYRNGDKMIAVQVATSPAFSAGRPTVLFTGRFLFNTTSSSAFDVSPDGQRFLM